jgi:hypothetical protein
LAGIALKGKKVFAASHTFFTKFSPVADNRPEVFDQARRMEKILFALVLAAAGIARLAAGGTLQLQLVPDRDVLLKDLPQEVVVKIDPSAVAGKKKAHRTPLNLAVVIDKSGSMTGAKLDKTKQAAMQLVDRLAPADVFSLVIFSDHACAPKNFPYRFSC